MRRLNKYDIHPKNSFWVDVAKFNIALRDSNMGKLITINYVREKLQQILLQEATWHPLVDEAYKEAIAREKDTQ